MSILGDIDPYGANRTHRKSAAKKAYDNAQQDGDFAVERSK
jgi:hypothetical protein